MTKIYRDEVYNGRNDKGTPWQMTHWNARDKGFKYWTIDLNFSYFGVYSSDGPGHTHHAICCVADLLDRKVAEFQDKVMEFALDPARSAPDILMANLSARTFFSSDEEGQKKIVNDLLDSNIFCDEGKERFRDHMGDLLPTPKINKFILEVEVDFPESYGGSIAGDTQVAVRKYGHTWEDAKVTFKGNA